MIATREETFIRFVGQRRQPLMTQSFKTDEDGGDTPLGEIAPKWGEGTNDESRSACPAGSLSEEDRHGISSHRVMLELIR